MTRTNAPKRNTLRRELECYVTSHNKYLKHVIKSMNIITLLRNAHPVYRSNFATLLEKAGLITEYDSYEFVKIR